MLVHSEECPAPVCKTRQRGGYRRRYERTVRRPVRQAAKSPFPVCRLYGRRIVGTLPEGCPLAEDKPGEALRRMKATGLWDARSDPKPAVLLMEAYDVCSKCVMQRQVR